jgi:hypothetical protein
VAAANRAGGEDNVTVVVFEILDGEPLAEEAAAHDPDEPTAEAAVTVAATVEPAATPERPVRRHGPGAGGRWLALGAILLALAAATLLVWWGLTR